MILTNALRDAARAGGCPGIARVSPQILSRSLAMLLRQSSVDIGVTHNERRRLQQARLWVKQEMEPALSRLAANSQFPAKVGLRRNAFQLPGTNLRRPSLARQVVKAHEPCLLQGRPQVPRKDRKLASTDPFLHGRTPTQSFDWPRG